MWTVITIPLSYSEMESIKKYIQILLKLMIVYSIMKAKKTFILKQWLHYF